MNASSNVSKHGSAGSDGRNPASILLGPLGRRGLTVVGINGLIAVGLTLFGSKGFGANLLYSQCIGLGIWALVDGGRMALIRDWDSQAWRLLVIVPVGVTVGFAFGGLLGDLALGAPALQFWRTQPRQSLGLLTMSLVAGIAITYFFLSRERLAAVRLREQAARQLASDAHLRLLQSQLEPHMLFNTLAALRALIATDADRAIDMLDRLNGYLRATLRATRAAPGRNGHCLADEVGRLQDYLELMSVRMGPRLSYTIDLPPHLGPHPVPPLLLQPIVENAVRHGLEASVAGGHIGVSAATAGDRLVLTVEDDGAGFDRARVAPACAGAGDLAGGGYGLQQVRERLAASFGADGAMTIATAPGRGTKVEVSLPLQSRQGAASQAGR
jgi:signal transduction histidine kinase